MKKVNALLLSIFLIFSFVGCSAPDPAVGLPQNLSENHSEYSAPESGVTESAVDAPKTPIEPPTVSESPTSETDQLLVMLTVGDAGDNQVFWAEFYDNESAQAIIAQMPFSLNMSDYAGQEKTADLSFELPAASTETPDTIKSGELYLWSGNSFVLFYTTFSNAYSYVPIGFMEDTSGLAKALGDGNMTVSFTLME